MLGVLLKFISMCGGVWSTSSTPASSTAATEHAAKGRDGLLWWQDLACCHSGELSISVVQGNNVLKDQCHVKLALPIGTCLSLPASKEHSLRLYQIAADF
ncbi:hypothetical protein GUJ93_ZPchr0012g21453 [Zizania palustris]|uniref:Secreted protein n=1 Tax=Zizania palustris TaxID=103762 RepID=A0A8J5WWT9_ZIZPA|nr:hypothetical protein GUJ93_ZPchr0012g22184 [Zizania palustris]KAG8094792.1 hypothetical protein GUJ93_ZPchr0012g21453 [Zizania palustris]